VLETAFHHMTEYGYYDGWTEHTVRVYPEFDGFRMTISGRNRNDIKDYIYDTFHDCLSDLYDDGTQEGRAGTLTDGSGI
jgi:hypothetical protein